MIYQLKSRSFTFPLSIYSNELKSEKNQQCFKIHIKSIIWPSVQNFTQSSNIILVVQLKFCILNLFLVYVLFVRNISVIIRSQEFFGGTGFLPFKFNVFQSVPSYLFITLTRCNFYFFYDLESSRSERIWLQVYFKVKFFVNGQNEQLKGYTNNTI